MSSGTSNRPLLTSSPSLVAASAYLLTRATTQDWRELAITAGVAVLASETRVNPLWPLGAAALVGYVGLL